MRKLFLFATVAAAGLFASCSSSDDLSEGGSTAYENVDGDNVPIKIGIGNLAGMTTRGTGTVGGVGTDATAAFYSANQWNGQYINVFMFDQGTFTPTKETSADNKGMYENRKMVTPGSAENLIVDGTYVGATPAASGEAMNADASIKYYPLQNNYDFFGYRVDDAANAYETTGEPILDVSDANKWTVPFTIDGSQDLMTTKAMLTAEDKVKLKGSPDYYSAKAARKDVQPVLTFNHLLTRLQFNLFSGNVETAGYGKDYVVASYKPKATITKAQYDAYTSNAATAASLWTTTDDPVTENTVYNATATTITAQQFTNDVVEADKALFEPATYGAGRDKERAIKIESIQVLSKTDGKMLVAWKNDDADAKVVSYRMNAIEDADAPGANWTETNTNPHSGIWYWNSNDIVVSHDDYQALTNNTGYVDLSTLSAAEQAAAVAEKDMPAYKKITWDATQEADKAQWKWLNLKQRAAWTRNENVTAAEGDVEGYADAKADKDTKETTLTAAQEAIATNGALYTTLDNAIATLAAKKTALDDAKSALATAKSNLANANPTDANYADLQQAVTDAETALGTAQSEYDTALTERRQAQEDYDAALAAYYAAKKAYDAAKILADQLDPTTLMAETISQDVYDMLTAQGQAKYSLVVNEMNTNLAPLAPTAADVVVTDYHAGDNDPIEYTQIKDQAQTPHEVGVQVGDALLIAPNQYAANGTVTPEPLKMKVKLSQKVPVNWNYPRTYEYKSQEFEVDIPLPTKKSDDSPSAFMINNSYNVNIWVYGFSRIKIITVINEWKDGGNIEVGGDE